MAAGEGPSVENPTAVAMQRADLLEHTRRLAEKLSAALASRMVVEQAVGVLVARHVDPASARQQLDELSSERGEALEVVARALVDEAVRRAAGRGPAGRPGYA